MTTENDAMDRFLERAARGFEAEAPVLAGDDKRIERIERAVQRRYGQAVRRPAAWRQVALAVACGLLMTGVALAAFQLISGRQAAPGPEAPALAPPVLSVVRVPVRAPATSGEPKPEAELPASLPVPAPEAVAPSLASAAPRASAPNAALAVPTASSEPSAKAFDDAPSAATAGDLFAAASQARVAGDAARAIALSEQLLRQFPKSAEASATHRSLGMLLLQQGQAGRALGEFEAYERLGAGQGRAEALWGKAQALQRLGRAAEERAVLTELVEAYPRAAYTAAAKKRLAALQ